MSETVEVDAPRSPKRGGLDGASGQSGKSESRPFDTLDKSPASPKIVQSPSPISTEHALSSPPSKTFKSVPPPPTTSHEPVIDSPSPSPSASHSQSQSPRTPKVSPMKRDSTSITHLEDLQTSRPAPASPASSRPSSTLFDNSAAAARDRSGSTASSSALAGGMGVSVGRRISSASSSKGSTPRPGSASRNRSTSRAGSTGQGRSAARPKSMLGTNITLPEPTNYSSSSLDRQRDEKTQQADSTRDEDATKKQSKHESIPEYPQSNIVTEHQVRGDTTTQQAENQPQPRTSTSTTATLGSTSTIDSEQRESEQRDSLAPTPQVSGDSETSSFVLAGNLEPEEPGTSSTPTTTLSSALESVVKEVIVRDFAYDPSDERFHGRGVISLRESTSSITGVRWPWRSGAGAGDAQGSSPESSTAAGGGGGGWGGFGLIGGWRGFGNRAKQAAARGDDEDDDEDDDEEDEDDEEDYRIGAGAGVGGRRGNGNIEGDDEMYYSSPAQSDSRSLSDQEDSQMADDDDEERDGARISGSIHLNADESSGSITYKYKILPLLPESEEPSGHYRASYPFEALSSSEMTLSEGDLLKISGRGNGDPGWVIARKVVLGEKGNVEGIEERVGLVPEGYLERVEVVEDE
ncbi:hypothetical protein I316_00671 [Kwoniella heveanensis BCC8398]|uniref:SH3 domain-containing protein n=1 Tax=Kwoniella heveanensis BCC8398 TaxID=1296120 RepID=A0A1B9H2P3_9TREE|nr:hypothetical protein I316_00671 [Kwoniella heveanensis BCC8398]